MNVASGRLASVSALIRPSSSLAMLAAMRRASSRVALFSGQSKPRLPHAQRLDHCKLAITDTIKDVSRILSGHTDVDLYRDAVHALAQSRGLLRQRSASLDPICGNRRQFVGGSGNARPILRR